MVSSPVILPCDVYVHDAPLCMRSGIEKLAEVRSPKNPNDLQERKTKLLQRSFHLVSIMISVISMMVNVLNLKVVERSQLGDIQGKVRRLYKEQAGWHSTCSHHSPLLSPWRWVRGDAGEDSRAGGTVPGGI